MYYPNLEEVKQLAEAGNLIPVYREVRADLETPVSAFVKIARGKHSFLLESVEGGERLARYSFMGTEPYAVLRTGVAEPLGAVDPLASIQKEMSQFKLVPITGLPRFHGGAVGYLAYDVVRYFEPRVALPEMCPLDLPESYFFLLDTLLVFDHLKHRIKVVSHARVNGSVEEAYRAAAERIDALVERLHEPLKFPPAAQSALPPMPAEGITANMSKKQFEDMVVRAKEYIYAGDVIQVVLSQRLSKRTRASPFEIYRSLRSINPSPYMYYLQLDGFSVVGSSPELLVRVEDGAVAVHPIAGTRPRGADSAQDMDLEKELRQDEKERAEHIMLVDLGRNDVGRVSVPGSVKVTQLMDVERYSHVMHLVSHVTGQLRPELTCYDALRACFPAGTVSGAPKIRAMEIISELEPDRRGPYAGAVGYFSFSGNMDTAITLRTIDVKDGVAYVQAGAGIVADSQPVREYEECFYKAQALLRAIADAEGLAG